MSDEAEDEGGLSPVKADNEVWRDFCHWESEISIGYYYKLKGLITIVTRPDGGA